MFSSRGLRFVKVLENYAKNKPIFFDTLSIFNKIKFTSLTDECLQATFKVDSSMCNGSSIIHGGYVASIIDVSCVYANLAKTNGRMGLTTNLCVNYIKSARIGDEVTVEVKTLKKGSTPILEAVLSNEDGSLIAKGTSTFVIGNDQFQKQCADVLNFNFMEYLNH